MLLLLLSLSSYGVLKFSLLDREKVSHSCLCTLIIMYYCYTFRCYFQTLDMLEKFKNKLHSLQGQSTTLADADPDSETEEPKEDADLKDLQDDNWSGRAVARRGARGGWGSTPNPGAASVGSRVFLF